MNASVGKLNALLGDYRNDRDAGFVLSREKGKEKEVPTREWKKSTVDTVSRPPSGTKINWGSSSSRVSPDIELLPQSQTRLSIVPSIVPTISKPIQSQIPTPILSSKPAIINSNTSNSSPPPAVTLLLSRLPTNRNPRAPQDSNSTTSPSTKEVEYSPIPEERDEIQEYFVPVAITSKEIESPSFIPVLETTTTLSKDQDLLPAETVINQNNTATSAISAANSSLEIDQDQDVLSLIPVPDTKIEIAQNQEQVASTEPESQVEDDQVALTLIPRSEMVEGEIVDDGNNISVGQIAEMVQDENMLIEEEVLVNPGVTAFETDTGMNYDDVESDFVIVRSAEDWESIELKSDEGKVDEKKKVEAETIDEDELMY